MEAEGRSLTSKFNFVGLHIMWIQVAYYATSRMMSLPSHIYANAIFMLPAKNLKYKYAGCRQNNAFNPDFENITFLHQVRIPIPGKLP